MANTGHKAWATLEEYTIATGLATGKTKPNNELDPDYVPPVQDFAFCPVGVGDDRILTIEMGPWNESTFSVTISRDNPEPGDEIQVSWRYRYEDTSGGVFGWQNGPVATLGAGDSSVNVSHTVLGEIMNVEAEIVPPIPAGYSIG